MLHVNSLLFNTSLSVDIPFTVLGLVGITSTILSVFYILTLLYKIKTKESFNKISNEIIELDVIKNEKTKDSQTLLEKSNY